MTTLQAYCNVVEWQGGTIHQARADFLERSQTERDRIVRNLIKIMGNISDYSEVGWFSSANINHIEFVNFKIQERN